MPTTSQRGYGSRHQQLRKQWSTAVAAGQVNCARCGNPIIPGTPWDLGHTDDRLAYTGPEHRSCNRRAGGIRGNQSPKRKRANTWRPRLPEYAPTDYTWTVTPPE